MNKKFTRIQLLDQIGFSAEEVDIVLRYQKQLPILCNEDNEDNFCVDLRTLYVYLSKTHDLSHFARWAKRLIKNYGFVENLDFTMISPIGRDETGGNLKSTDYLCTMDMAKQVAMIDKSEVGNIARRYFILMEEAAKALIEWNIIRYPLRKGYKRMDEELDAYYMRNDLRHADDHDFAAEADMLNMIACGATALEIRIYVGCQDKITRDSLTVTYNEYLLKLQEWNTIYIGMNLNRAQRYKMLEQSFNIMFPNAVPIKSDVEISKIIENKRKYFKKLEINQRVAS